MKSLIAALHIWFRRIQLWVLTISIFLGGLVSYALTSAQPIASANPTFAGWIDRDGTATVETVQQLASWEPFSGWKSWGFGRETVWLQITVPAADRSDAPPQILVVRPSFLDRVTFYDPTTGAVRHSGDFLPAREEALGSVLFTFEVAAKTQTREVLIQLESTSTRLVHLSLMPLVEAQSFTRWVEWVTSGALLLSLVFSVWAIMLWRITRDQITATFAFSQMVATLWGFFLYGFARITVGEWFPVGWLSLTTSVLATVLASATFWFFSTLLLEYSARAWMLWVLRASGWVFLGLAIFCVVGPTYLALKWINSLVSFMLVWLILTIFFSSRSKIQPPVPRAVILAHVFLYALLNAIPILTYLNLIPESRILFFGNMSNLVANGLVMLIILWVRQRRLRAQHDEITDQLVLQQAQTRLNQQHLDDQRQLLAMLAHEIKTPLANLRIWMEAGDKGRPAMERAIRDINLVIERCVQSGQLSDQSLQPHNERLNAAELTRDILASSRQPERVHADLPPDPCRMQADAQMLSIVLSNVLENAYKYSPPDTPINLSLKATNGPQDQAGWCWHIENLVGSAEFPDSDKLFKKYYRSPMAHRQSGSGLGLFLVKALLTLMHGEVNYSQRDDMVSFTVWLPVNQDASTA
jgi:signal transduction histidine kinase